MNAFGLRLMEHVHGHAGWISAIALAHPAALLRRPQRKAPVVALVATGVVTLTAALGAAMYSSYRTDIKPLLVAASPAVANVFERKEHWGVAALVLAWIGFVLHWSNCQADVVDRRLARSACAAYAGAAGLSLLAAIFGVVVATHLSF